MNESELEAIFLAKKNLVFNSLIFDFAVKVLENQTNISAEQWAIWLINNAEKQVNAMTRTQIYEKAKRIENIFKSLEEEE